MSPTGGASSPPWRELGVLLILALIWSSSFMLIKVSIETIPPLTLAAGRLILAAGILISFAAWAGHRIPLSPRVWMVFLFIGFFGNALPYALIGWGEVYIDSSLAAILMAVMPVTTAVLAHFFTPGERLNPMRFLGVVVGFSGIVVLMGADALSGLGSALLAQLAVLAGASSYAITTIFARHHIYLPGPVLAAGSTLIGAALVLPPALLKERPWELEPTAQALIAATILGIACTGLATLIYFRLIRSIGPTLFSQINFLIPIMGVGWGMALLAERPGWQAAAALCMVLSGVGLVNRYAAGRQ